MKYYYFITQKYILDSGIDINYTALLLWLNSAYTFEIKEK